MTSGFNSQAGGVWRRSLYILHTLLPFARRSRAWFVCGCLAASGVVAARLALPWPLGAVTDLWTSNDPNVESGLAALVPDWADYVLWMGAMFLVIILLLGLFDFLNRLYFARFAIGTVRDIRSKAFWSVMRVHGKTPKVAAAEDDPPVLEKTQEAEEEKDPEVRTAHSGDLIARLVGDSARAKAGLQGFLVHVATNSVVYLAMTIILFTLDVNIGLIFAAAGFCTASVTIWCAARLFKRSVQHRKKEGKLAQNIQDALENDLSDAAFVKINKSSGRHEASLTRIQGIATWSAHVLFGMAVLGALWAGARAVDAGNIAIGDMVVMMMYALLMRGPIVRLARQGSRTGKILGAAHRLVQMLEAAPTIKAESDEVRLMPLRDRLRLSGVTLGASPIDSARQLGPIDVELRAGERIAVVGSAGAGKTAFLTIIAGEQNADEGSIVWDGMSLADVTPCRRTKEIVYLPRAEFGAARSSPFNQILRDLALLTYRRGSVWMFDDPCWNLSGSQAREVMDVLLNEDRSTTIIVATSSESEIHRFDRVLYLQQGRLVFDGTPSQWRRFKRREKNVAATLHSAGGGALASRH